MLELVVNGEHVAVEVGGDTSLLTLLRELLGLTGSRFGCGLGQCGACTVLVDGRPTTSCSVAAEFVAGSAVTTVEGLGDDAAGRSLRDAFIVEQAAQCGYCLSGIIVRAAALLRAEPAATEADIRAALDSNLCRCGSHNRIVRAVLRAARRS